MVDIFKGFGILLISCCMFVPEAQAQTNLVDFDLTMTATPAQFGPAGTLVHFKAESDTYINHNINMPTNSVGHILRQSSGMGGGQVPCDTSISGRIECECVYVVQPADVTAGQLTWAATFSGDEYEDQYDPITGLPIIDPDTGQPIQLHTMYMAETESSDILNLTHNPSVTSYPAGTGVSNCTRPVAVDAGPDFFAIPGSVINLTANVSNSADLTNLSYSWSQASMFSGTENQQNPTFTVPLTPLPNTLVEVRVTDGFHLVGDHINVVSTANNGCAPQSSALMPSSQSPGNFIFTIPVNQVCPNLFWIDPPVATGYDYTVSGAEFKTIQMPSTTTVPDQNGYDLIVNGGTPIALAPDEIHSFTTPVSSFSIRGIDIDLELDPEYAMAFALGIDLTDPAPGATHVVINQAVFTEDTGSGLTSTNSPPIAVPSINWSYVYSGRPGVQLSAAASSDPNNNIPLTYTWTEMNQGFAPASLTPDMASDTATFTAPVVTASTNYYFDLKTKDSLGLQSAGPSGVSMTVVPDACTPYDSSKLLDELRVSIGGSANSDFTLKANVLKLQSTIQDYVTQAQSQNPMVSGATHTMTLKELGTSAQPMSGPGNPIADVESHSASVLQGTFALGTSTGAASEFWQGKPLKVDHWYRLRSHVKPVHNGGGMFDNCTSKIVDFRLPRVPSTGRRYIMNRPIEYYDAKNGTITTGSVRIYNEKAIDVTGTFGTLTPSFTGVVPPTVVTPPVVTTTPGTVMMSPIITSNPRDIVTSAPVTISNPMRVVTPGMVSIQKKKDVIKPEKEALPVRRTSPVKR